MPSSTFEPIEMDFPDTTRTKQEAKDYVDGLKKKFGAGAIDTNLIMTGESCARGRGSMYHVVRM